MYYLGLDTTNKYLIVSIFNEDDVLYFYQDKTSRNVSENANVIIDEALRSLGLTAKDLIAVVVTRGPGGFTGVRIGLSIAKVLTYALSIDLYTLSSLQYYSGNTSVPVILDARSKKVYYGQFENGILTSEKLVLIDELPELDKVKGDASLINLEDDYSNLRNNFMILKDQWINESSFDAVPTYLKNNL